MSAPATEMGRELFVPDYVKARADDIACLLAAIDNAGLPRKECTRGPRTSLQHMPRHMRRRAMSHNVNRFPKSQRRFAQSQAARTKHKKKPPSRYWRRRPSHLLQAYVRRQRHHKWLETHIWHAKRFHMVDAWGYRLPQRSCARGHRAAYRDVRSHAIVQDISFYVALEVTVSGARETLLPSLNKLLHGDNTLSFAYRAAFTGHEQCSVLLQDVGSGECLGPAAYHWTAVDCLWLWTHPACTALVLLQLCTIMQLTKCESRTTTPPAKVESLTAAQMDAVRAEIADECYVNAASGLQVRRMADQLGRIRIVGAKSTNLVLSAVGSECDVNIQPKWAHLVSSTAQTATAAAVPPAASEQTRVGRILTGCVPDPRCSRPASKRAPTSRLALPGADVPPADQGQLVSALYSQAVRAYVLEHKPTDLQVHEARADGADQLAQHNIGLPLLLIRTEQGWDMVLPAGYVKAMWLCLQYNAARATGLQVHRHLMLERGMLNFPDCWPDTAAGRLALEAKATELQQVHERRPPNRRAKYDRLRVTHPFAFDWLDLLRGWQLPSQPPMTGYRVLRHRQQLRRLCTWLSTVGRPNAKLDPDVLRLLADGSLLIPVRLTAAAKGTMDYLSLICLPAAGDDMQQRQHVHTEPQPHIQPEQPTAAAADTTLHSFIALHGDKELSLDELLPDVEADKQQQRADRRTASRRRQRANKRRASSASITNDAHATPNISSSSSVAVKPDVVKSVRHSCSRQVIGALLHADYTFSHGCYTGVGLCAAIGLDALQSCLVLSRARHSQHYYAARLHIITDCCPLP